MVLPWKQLDSLYSSGSAQHRIAAFDGIRAVAVLMVFCTHYNALFRRLLQPGSVVHGVADAAGWIGHGGVDLFFILSGYLIYGGLIRRPKPIGLFMRRRIQRLYPAFLPVLATYVVLSLVFPTHSKLPPGWVPALTYLAQNVFLLPLAFGLSPIIQVTWSLGFEVLFYLTIPLLVVGLRLRSWASRWRTAFFSGVILSIFLMQFLLPPSIPKPDVQYSMFAAGILVYEAVHGFRLDRIINKWWSLAGVALVLAGSSLVPAVLQTPPGEVDLNSGVAWTTRSLIILPVYAVLVFFAYGRGTSLVRFLTWRPLLYLGSMSYSYYLVHGLAMRALTVVAFPLLAALGVSTGAPVVFVVLVPVALACTLVAGTVLYALVEKPLSMPLLERKGQNPRASTALEPLETSRL